MLNEAQPWEGKPRLGEKLIENGWANHMIGYWGIILQIIHTCTNASYKASKGIAKWVWPEIIKYQIAHLSQCHYISRVAQA